MVFKGSRYTRINVIQPLNSDGKSPRVLAERPIVAAPGKLEYVVSDGERLDQLSSRFFGEATKYWLILDANLDVLNPFELLQAGIAIHVPQNVIVHS